MNIFPNKLYFINIPLKAVTIIDYFRGDVYNLIIPNTFYGASNFIGGHNSFMKSFTRNFIAIMFAGILIITMLTNNFFAADRPINIQTDKNSQSSNPNVSIELLSPDEIDPDRAFSSDRMGGADDNTDDTEPSTFSTSEDENITTVTTNLPTDTTTVKTTTTLVPQKENDAQHIKNPNYKSKYYIVVYTGNQSVVVYGKDDTGAYSKIIKKFTCSSGNKSNSPTRKGLYAVKSKYRWQPLMGGVYGQYCSGIGSNYLFHSVPYAAKDPSSLYDASYDNLGRAVSHGCIRMCVRDCKWIYDNVPIGTQVNVVLVSGPAGAGVPKRKSGAKYRGWDPSDKWAEGNPYFDESEDTKTTTKKPTKTTTSNTSASTQSSVTSSNTTVSTNTTSHTTASHTTASTVATSQTTTSTTASTTSQTPQIVWPSR